MFRGVLGWLLFWIRRAEAPAAVPEGLPFVGGCALTFGAAAGATGVDFFADRLPIVVAHHHDDVFGLFCRDDLARYLRPFAVAALIVADEAEIGAVFAHDADLGLLGKGILKPIGKPVRVGVAHHHNLDRGILAWRRRRRVGIIRRFFSFRLPHSFSLARVVARAFTLTIAPKAPRAVTPEAAERIVRLLALLRLLPSAPGVSPELRVARNHKSEHRNSGHRQSDDQENGGDRPWRNRSRSCRPKLMVNLRQSGSHPQHLQRF